MPLRGITEDEKPLLEGKWQRRLACARRGRATNRLFSCQFPMPLLGATEYGSRRVLGAGETPALPGGDARARYFHRAA